jgi:hypothetical protein
VTVATLDDIRRLAFALPEVEEATNGFGMLGWSVHGKAFAWERPLRASDIDELGEAAPTGTVLCVRVPDEGVKQALLGAPSGIFFATRHFAGFPAVLVRLDDADPAELAEVLEDAWLARAPKRLARAYLDSRATG